MRREGLARDFVRLVQEARKEAGLQIENTIRVTYHVPEGGEAAAAIADFAPFIEGETLARELAAGEPAPGAYVAATDAKGGPLTLGGEPVQIGITRVE